MIPDEILKGLKWKPFREVSKGGQVAGWPPGYYGARLIHEELGFEVATDYRRSQIANKDMCMTLFELFYMEVTK